MAGDTTPVVNNWILDYYTYSAWEEFKNDRTLSTSTIESISGILGQTWEGDEHRNDKKLFLTILSRLKDGSDINMRYDGAEGCEETPLEDLLPHFMNLVNYQIDRKLIEDGESLYKVIQCEAVRTCCRAEDFERAQTVLERYHLQNQKGSMIKELKALIKKKDKETNLGYHDFVTPMIEYLSLVADSFEEPTIVVAAKVFLKRKSCSGSCKNNDSVDRIPERELLDEVEKETPGKNNNSIAMKNDKQKLRKLWDSKMKDMFGEDSLPEKTEVNAVVPETPGNEPSSCNKAMSRTSTPKKDGSGSFKVPFTKPSSSDRPHSRTSTPKKSESGNAKSPYKKTAATNGFSSPLRKSGPVSTVSPVQRSSVSESSGEDSPEFRYRKNKGRNDRHQPVMSSTRCSAADNMSDVSSVYGGRKRKWTHDEMLEFYDAVNTIGVGKWAQIKEYLGTSRNGVMLKDKWRNMLKSGDVDKIREKRVKKR